MSRRSHNVQAPVIRAGNGIWPHTHILRDIFMNAHFHSEDVQTLTKRSSQLAPQPDPRAKQSPLYRHILGVMHKFRITFSKYADVQERPSRNCKHTASTAMQCWSIAQHDQSPHLSLINQLAIIHFSLATPSSQPRRPTSEDQEIPCHMFHQSANC